VTLMMKMLVSLGY